MYLSWSKNRKEAEETDREERVVGKELREVRGWGRAVQANSTGHWEPLKGLPFTLMKNRAISIIPNSQRWKQLKRMNG